MHRPVATLLSALAALALLQFAGPERATASPRGETSRVRAPEGEPVPPEVSVGVAPTPFSPNGDGRRDTTTISVTVSEPASVTVTVLDGDGTAQRTWSRTVATPGTFEIPWQGGVEGRTLADGRYLVEAVAETAPEITGRDDTPVVIDTRAPRIRRFRVGPDPLVDHRWLAIRFLARDRTPQMAAHVEIEDATGRVGRVTEDVERGRVRLRWRARTAKGGRLFPGNYTARVRLRDDAGNLSRRRTVPWRVHRSVGARVYTRLDGAGRRVALTFDDCHVRRAWARILRVLASRRARATFFCPGQLVRANPDLARKTVRAGHTPAAHAWDHANLAGRDSASTAWRLRADRAAWWDVARRTSAPYFRPPYGAYDGAVLRAAAETSHPRVMLWDVDPADWTRPGSSTIVSRVLARARPGSVVLLHTIDQTATAIAQIVDGLRARRLEPVTLPELFRAARMR